MCGKVLKEELYQIKISMRIQIMYTIVVYHLLSLNLLR